MSKLRHMPALDADMQESPFGRLFVDPGTAKVTDLSGVQVVHFGTDTVRQLYRGLLRPGVLALFNETGLVDFAGERWSAGRVGRDSGYQYRLQNADLGLILLIKSFHAPADVLGPHLKIEVSPHCIRQYDQDELQSLLDSFADSVLDHRESRQCAVHVALDVQGWVPPSDFEARMHCRSRRVRQYHGIGSVDFASNSAIYGRGETWMFGSPSSVQLAVYDKSQEAKVRDKLDYWQGVWAASGHYSPEQPVYRIEFRFHHSVVEQFAQGTVDMSTGATVGFYDYAGLYDHLDGLWRYGCEAFRYLARPGWFDPFWTLVSQQAMPLDPTRIKYRRHYKTASGFSGKNIELLLGNFISMAARQRMTARNTWRALKGLPFFEVVTEHYRLKGRGERDLRRHIGELLEDRYVRWGRAI